MGLGLTLTLTPTRRLSARANPNPNPEANPEALTLTLTLTLTNLLQPTLRPEGGRLQPPSLAVREREVVRVHDAPRRDMIATDARVLDRTARQQQWWLVPQHLGLGLGLGLG